MRDVAVVAGAALAVALAAVPVARASDDAEDLARLKQEIHGIIGDEVDCYNIVHCLVMSMGDDGCGNPTYFVGYSNRNSIKAALEAKAAEYTFIEGEMRRAQPKPASCKPVVVPQPICHRNHCSVGEPIE
ncbi:MAG: hypothetical protein GC151_02865 [Betaproteobacteria bacterium]|nr:hypothetical protein [Betaproteobacteria bacterium]